LSGTGSSSGTGSAAGQSTGSAATATVPSAEDLAADQAAIDLAQINVQIAQQNLASATLTSPIAGTVAAVSIVPGTTVSESSTTAVITVLAPGAYRVATTAPLAVIDKVKVGQQATVRVDGVDTPLTGTVATIGLLKASTSTSSTTTYPVMIALDPTDTTLYTGSGATVSVTIGQVDNALTVPSSAIHTEGSRTSVTMVANGVTESVTVTIGAVGTDRTQILSGLSAGDSVVLADLTEPLPTSTASTRAAGAIGGAGAFGGVGGSNGTGNAGGRGGAGVVNGAGVGAPPAGPGG
jgi:RND family efflux transporter MFP subunit